MTLTEKIFAMRATPCFSRLSEGDLTLIADVAREREFAPGESFCETGRVLQKFYVVTRGAVQGAGGRAMPAVVGAASLLLNLPVREELKASPREGATCLVIGKGYFFTLVYQCPSVVRQLLELEHSEVRAPRAGEASS